MAEATTPDIPQSGITVEPYREDGRNVYADGALLGRYWPGERPKRWKETADTGALCEPGIHAEKPFHARPLFGLGPATHHSSPEEAIMELLRARDRPNREQVEVYDALREPEPGIPEAVRYARHILRRHI